MIKLFQVGFLWLEYVIERSCRTENGPKPSAFCNKCCPEYSILFGCCCRKFAGLSFVYQEPFTHFTFYCHFNRTGGLWSLCWPDRPTFVHCVEIQPVFLQGQLGKRNSRFTGIIFILCTLLFLIFNHHRSQCRQIFSFTSSFTIQGTCNCSSSLLLPGFCMHICLFSLHNDRVSASTRWILIFCLIARLLSGKCHNLLQDSLRGTQAQEGDSGTTTATRTTPHTQNSCPRICKHSAIAEFIPRHVLCVLDFFVLLSSIYLYSNDISPVQNKLFACYCFRDFLDFGFH